MTLQISSFWGIIEVSKRQIVLAIKELIGLGYKDKHICMIVQVKQPYVSKIRHGKIHVNTNPTEEEKDILNKEQRKRLDMVNLIMSAPELITSGMTEQDTLYIHLLKFCMVKKEKIYKLYFHITKTAFNKIWTAKDVNILEFDSKLLGIDSRDYLDLIIDYFL